MDSELTLKCWISGLTLAFLASCAPPTSGGDPMTAIGQVQLSSNARCSGTIIAPKLVLTAGHCVANTELWQAVLPSAVTFRLPQGSFPVSFVELSPESPFDQQGGLRDVANDWAYLHLTVALDIKPLAMADGNWQQLAFILDEPVSKAGWDVQSRFRLDEGCKLLGGSASTRGLHFQCGTGSGGGRSGSPLLIQTENGQAVLAVQSAITETGDDQEIGIAAIPAPSRLAQEPL